MSKKKSKEENDFDRMFNDTRMKRLAVAMEAINFLFKKMPFGETLEFTDGTNGKVTVFFEPTINEVTHTMEAGIDIKIYDNVTGDHIGHLEFCLSMSGWGGVPQKNLAILGKIE